MQISVFHCSRYNVLNQTDLSPGISHFLGQPVKRAHWHNDHLPGGLGQSGKDEGVLADVVRWRLARIVHTKDHLIVIRDEPKGDIV